METILFVNHKERRCGVYEFGKAIGKVVSASKKYKFIYVECDTRREFEFQFSQHRPVIVIYNYHPMTLSWAVERTPLRVYKNYLQACIHVGMIHEIFQEVADAITNKEFDYHICADPTLLLKNPLVFKTGRLILSPSGRAASQPVHQVPVFGSFGFATGGKGFEKIIEAVQQEYDEAVIRLNISFSTYLDEDGTKARDLAKKLRAQVYKRSVKLEIAHDHLDEHDLLKFLSENDANLFLYEHQNNRGISSVVDWAMASRRPLIITKSQMFRHLFDSYPSICIEDRNIRQIVADQPLPYVNKLKEWSPANLLWDYERIIGEILGNQPGNIYAYKTGKTLRLALHYLDIKVISPPKRELWLKPGDKNVFDGFVSTEYKRIANDGTELNIVLDDQARTRYAPTIRFLEKVAPKIIAKKIPAANVQQAFVLDTVCYLSSRMTSPARILSVGAFEDTAAIVLQKLGYQIELIDPLINYDLETFITKPTVRGAAYDIIFSTSVIEHVLNDEKFVNQIGGLLAPGGYVVMTCDYHDGYEPGNALPPTDYRLYTKNDLSERLIKHMPACELYGKPNWHSTAYDFCLSNRYWYAFATFVARKIAQPTASSE
jgi:SAM-dependent methyltransferase